MFKVENFELRTNIDKKLNYDIIFYDVTNVKTLISLCVAMIKAPNLSGKSKTWWKKKVKFQFSNLMTSSFISTICYFAINADVSNFCNSECYF